MKNKSIKVLFLELESYTRGKDAVRLTVTCTSKLETKKIDLSADSIQKVLNCGEYLRKRKSVFNKYFSSQGSKNGLR